MPARSKLKNFAPKILLCAEVIVLSIRNANIVFPKPIVFSVFCHNFPPPQEQYVFLLKNL